MLKYRLKGIDPPGSVDLYKVGKVNLEDLPESKLDELYHQGCPYLELVIGTANQGTLPRPSIAATRTPLKQKSKKPR